MAYTNNCNKNNWPSNRTTTKSLLHIYNIILGWPPFCLKLRLINHLLLFLLKKNMAPIQLKFLESLICIVVVLITSHSGDGDNIPFWRWLKGNQMFSISSHSGNGDNIPFWRWLKGNQMFSISITCYDYDGEKLSNLQLNNVTGCFREYLCIFKSSNALLDTSDVLQDSNS